ncbi:MAG: ParA family protein [Chloroflexota bacterium]
MLIDTNEMRRGNRTAATTVVSFLKNKGGVGCTTNAYNFACWMAREGYSVLLLDGDMQGDCTALCRVAFEKPEERQGMYNLLVNGAAFDDVWCGVPGEFYGNPRGTLFLVPSDEASGKDIAQHLSANTVRDRLAEVEGRFDLVIVDTSPSASELHAGLYLASNYVVYPTQCQSEPINAIKRSLANYANYKTYAEAHNDPVAEILGIMPVMFRGRDMLQNQLKGWLEGRYAEWVMPEIRDLTAWQKAAASRLPVFIYDPSSDAAKDAVRVYQGFEAVIYGK